MPLKFGTKWTPKILDILKQKNVPGVFFVIGNMANQQPDILKREYSEGHEIGNHTFTHPRLIFESAARTRTELTECRAALTAVIGEHSNLFRPPFGTVSTEILRASDRLGLVTVYWNLDTFDWKAMDHWPMKRS